MKHKLLILIFIFCVGIIVPALAAFCPACGAQVADQDKFCRQCGHQLSQEIDAGQTTAPAEPPRYQTVAAASNQPQAFQVTTNYLNVNGYRLPRKSYFWIAEIVSGQARIWSHEGPPYDSLIMGWVSLNELEKRSTLTPGSTVVCAEPPPPTATKVIVVERVNFWRNWGPGPFFTPRYYHGRYGRSYCPR